jgi:hypothetical protein
MSRGGEEAGMATDPRAGRWGTMDQLFRMAMTLCVGSAVVALSKDRFEKLLVVVPTAAYLRDFESAVLLLVVVGLVFRWLFAVSGEMRLLRTYFEDQIAAQPAQVYVWTVVFSILLGTLGALTNRITLFSALFSVYSLADIWGQSLRDMQLKKVFRAVPAPSNSEDATKFEAIRDYFLDRPQMQRSATILFFSMTALLLSMTRDRFDAYAVWAQIGAYAIMILNICLSEIIIYRWRKARDAVLGDTYSF